MKFSIIGTGFIFPIHAEAIRDIGGEIRDVVNDVRGENEWKKMVETTDADCIVILTPNDLHYEMTNFSLANGKKVLCEKPLTIKSDQAETLVGKGDVFTVLQLHHHPVAKELKEQISKDKKYEVEMDISVYRDANYYKIWKGQKERSGGVLFNLGIHYFDMLLYLFGDVLEAKISHLDDKTGEGIISGANYNCRWRVSTAAAKDDQRRVFKINGISYNFSSKDNLSFENLHRFVYQDLLQGEGIKPEEAIKSIKLIERIYQSYEK
jgi:UDP-N-acetyl-2-amino-2-deoxyglucuronate dehydrogenase